MAAAVASRRKLAGLSRIYGATALACLFTLILPAQNAWPQDLPQLAPEIPDGSKMLLEADTLVYDQDANTVTAQGGVRIDYGGNRMVAESVTYDRKTSRLIATGNVQIIDSDGTKIYSQKMDVTDDFANGFVNALRVETVDKTYFAAESAERRGGFLTTFNNGVYTACAPCEEKPDKAPIWRIKARKIIWNGQAKTVRFEKSRFEFFGLPLAYFPAFEIADPTVKRKSGFLFPGITYRSGLGTGVIIPYYLALSPTYDLTVTGRGYTEQGFLGEAEWRQRFDNGHYSLKMAGIDQKNPSAFDANTVDSGPIGDPNKFRGMIGTQGRFDINPRWAYGWDILAQTDKSFSRVYSIDDFNQSTHISKTYLTGLEDRNYFDVRAMHFEVQEDYLDDLPNGLPNPAARSDKQPWVLPSMDYSYTPDESIGGGELNLDVNSRSLIRDRLDEAFEFNPTTPATVERVRGIEGESGRVTAGAEWKRTIITQNGLVVTPLLAFEADATYVDASASSVQAINDMAERADIRSAYYRTMATAGLELRWPVLFSSTSASHVFEPMAQVFARPDEGYSTTLGIPNEDAQSFVFDASTLFERDKFSGYDRVEGGTRANLGVRYTGSFDSGWTLNALAGQSYQLAGRNSFAAPDLVNVGSESGLETDSSDYVALAGIATPIGVSASVSARFDEQTFEVRRAEWKTAFSSAPITVSAKYAFIEAQPAYGFPIDRHEVTLRGATRFAGNWTLFGLATYDLEAELLIRDTAGISYADECFTYAMTMTETRSNTDDEKTQNFGFNISFRTLGDLGSSTNVFAPQ